MSSSSDVSYFWESWKVLFTYITASKIFSKLEERFARRTDMWNVLFYYRLIIAAKNHPYFSKFVLYNFEIRK